MRRLVFAALLALPVLALGTGAWADCGGTHGAAAPDQIAKPAPPPPPPGSGA